MRIVFYFLLACLATGALWAQENLPSQEVEKSSFIDDAHKSLSSSLFYFSNSIDSFFGGVRADDLPNGSRLRLYWLANKEEGKALKGESAVRANIVLVETQKKFKVSFKNKYEKESEQGKGLDQTSNTSSQTQVVPSDYDPNDLLRWRLKFDSGIRLEIPPEPFARLRLLKSWHFGAYELRPSQEFFWFLTDGFGESTKLDLDRPINENFLARYENDATWTDKNDYFTFYSGPALFQKLSDKRGISYNVKLSGISKPTWFVNDYRFEVTYRQLIFRKWIFIELTPFVHFPKTYDWKKVLGFNFRLELVIGKY
ncbi:MAG: hypothetical protein COW00_09860 [Bdellovibrio sp. CG12_big_fil_rev_8_21_14_0_65_39_13]|nr:MAG: hypothetical protein COW78_15835 [Bdellovibrio sp. CG22_combo_CG10-13_8_21_14_all_39_27]PIQ59605.1 MAG: hypothetical protein COW00_09860 [Bdellovibrio sp. CG12_big_fil_rev_8_21_14_0_65_39_13]